MYGSSQTAIAFPKIFVISTPKPEEKLHGKHPTQKPVELLNRIISASSSAGDVVLDPFNGSGTTGIVAKALHRRYIGIELDKRYLSTTVKRLKSLGAEQLSFLATAD